MGARKWKPDTEQVPEQPAGPVLVEPDRAKRPARMKQAMAECRREIAGVLPEVVRSLGREAVSGSVPHAKLFLELSGVLKTGLAAPDKAARERTLEEILVEQWEREKQLAAEDAAARDEERRTAYDQ